MIEKQSERRHEQEQGSRVDHSQYDRPLATAAGIYLVPNKGPFRIHCPRLGCTHFVQAPDELWATKKLQAHLMSPAHVGKDAA